MKDEEELRRIFSMLQKLGLATSVIGSVITQAFRNLSLPPSSFSPVKMAILDRFARNL